MRKGAIVSSSPQGIKLELKHKNLVFSSLLECIVKKKILMTYTRTPTQLHYPARLRERVKKICHGVKQYAKICAIGEQIEVFILGGQRIDQKRKKGWWRGRRERIEKGSRERIAREERKETKGN